MFYGISIIVAVIAFLFAAYLYIWVKRQPQENKRITEVAGLIRAGANTFMTREYKILAVFAAVVAVLILLFLPKPIWSNDAVWKNIAMAVAY
ncbi:MAG: sodium/proton-translocating pyrophosphatase, partial [Clostridia bacterium]|nr:sodium/proton-translocating pyrophosphatase [Clostridia bacterium]